MNKFSGPCLFFRSICVAALIASCAMGGEALGAVPTVAVTSPRAGADVTAPVSFTGTASEPHATITAVNYWITNLNSALGVLPVISGQAVLTAGAGGTYTWAFTASPGAGTNVLVVQSQDGAGALSAIEKVKFFVVSAVPLSVTVSGDYVGPNQGLVRLVSGGRAIPANGAMLNVGQEYTLVENPTNSYFINWKGNNSFVSLGSTSNSVLRFIMESNTAISANFITNIFVKMAGVYNGLFSSPAVGVPTDETSGMIANLILTPHGVYSGSVYLGGSSKAISGLFTPEGLATNTMTNSLDGTVQLVMSVDFNISPNTARLITGTVTGTNSITVSNVLQPGWSSSILAVASRTNTTNFPSAYTMLIPPGTSTNEFTNGTGFACITNFPFIDGVPATMRLVGVLADWTGFTEDTAINETNTLPIYQNYFNTPEPGMLFGWLNVLTNDPGLTGTLTWIRKTTANRFGLHTNGFTNNNITVQASPWSAAVPVTNYLSSTNTAIDPLPGSQLILSATNLNGPYVIDLGVEKNDITFKSRGGDNEFFSGSINTNTGRFTIEFTNAFRVYRIGYGAILQNTNSYGTNIGAGFFYMGSAANPTNIGSINLLPK